ncbi:hypothetical protein GF380_01080 [Candidatus Uhrbacteria bacterium]|nr:hypothetical protein [Candidatus Uhrbacteria bacterium]
MMLIDRIASDDDKMAELGCFYVRYMDDWVILAPTRWKLRQVIRAVNQVMNDLQVEKHPDKTFIGRIARGFDFLGYFFSGEGLGIGKKTIARMLDNVSLLYEQGADGIRIENYVWRWWLWVKGGVDGLVSTGTIKMCDRSCFTYNICAIARIGSLAGTIALVFI